MSVAEKAGNRPAIGDFGRGRHRGGFPGLVAGAVRGHEADSRAGTGPDDCGLARADGGISTSAGKALAPAKKRRIHTFIATSPIHMKHKLNKTPAEVLKMAVAAVTLAKTFTDDVEFSPEDACRSEMPFSD